MPPQSNLHVQANEVIQGYLISLLDAARLDEITTYMKGKIMMHKNEKMPWKSEGNLHAQVDCHVPVPRVMPAAMRAPTLS